MRVSFAMLVAAFTVCLSCVMSAPIIITDVTSGNNFSLPMGFPGTLYDAQYNTQTRTYQKFFNPAQSGSTGTSTGVSILPQSYSLTSQSLLLNVTWAGDFSDVFALAIPTGLNVRILAGSALGCNNVTQTTLNATNTLCLFNLSWTVSFQGTFSIVYQNSSFPQGSETVDITFVNNAAVVGDPQFVGLRGQSYQVHGIDGAVYNLITEQNAQVNSRFVFLTEGQCPILNGVPQAGCWSHPGSYMGDMSFQAVVDGKLHAALVTAGSAKKGFSGVQVDGKALKVGDKVSFGAFSVSFTSTHGAMVTLDNYNIDLSNSDMFVNMALTAKVPLSQLQSHGLIGQTHANKVYKTAARYIEGEVDDYLIADNDAFGTDFPFNRFNQ